MENPKPTQNKFLTLSSHFFDFIYRRRILPAKIYQNLKERPVKEKIQLIILNSSLPILTILAVVFIILIATVYLNQHAQFRAKKDATSNAFSYFEQQLKSYAELASSQDVIVKELLSSAPNSNRMQNVLLNLLGKLQVSDIKIYSKEGVVLVRTLDLADFGSSEYNVVVVQNSLTASKKTYFLEKYRQEWLLAYIQPIQYQGETIGAVSVAYLIDHKFANLLKEISGTDLFLSVQGDIISSSYGLIQPMRLDHATSGYWVKVKVRDKEKDKNLYLDQAKLIRDYKKVDGQKLTLELLLTQNNFTTEIIFFSAFILAILLSMLAFFISIALAVNVAAFIETGVKLLQDGMKKILAGDLNHQIPRLAQDEFGILANSFNEMSHTLKISYDNLRQLNEIGQQLAMIDKADQVLAEAVNATVELLRLQDAFIVEEDSNKDYQILYTFQRTGQNITIPARTITELKPAKAYTNKDANLPGIHQDASVVIVAIREENRSDRFFIISRQKQIEEFEINIFISIVRQIERSMARIQRLQLNSEIATAKVVQQALTPQKMPVIEGIEVFGIMNPAKGIGGDYFDFIVDSDERFSRYLWIVLGDVSGKGVPAGLIMVMARTFIHSTVGLYPSIKELFLKLNDFIFANSDNSKFMTGILARYNAHTGIIHLIGGGHEVILIYRSHNQSVEQFSAGGTILGIDSSENIKDLFHEMEVKLEEGDILLLFTDGLTEARDRKKEEFGLEKVITSLKQNCDADIETIIRKINADVFDFSSGAIQHDDITIMGVKKTTPLPSISARESFIIENLSHIQLQIDDGKLDTAATLLAEIEKKYPQNELVLCKKAHIFLKQNAFEKALGCYEKSLQIAPHFIEALNFAAITAHRMRLKEKALDYINRAIKLEPENQILRANLKKIAEN